MIDAVVDLSHWQTPVDFVAMRDAGILGVILKATQGSDWVDATFTEKLLAAHSAGLLLGAYHFADGSSPVLQVNNFLAHVSGIRLLAIDLESNAMGSTVSIAQAAEIAARIHSADGRAPLVYVPRGGPSGYGIGLPNSILSRCPLWFPWYPGYDAPAPIGLPSGWTSWHLWQHTETGRVAGYGGYVDRSAFNGTADELKTWWES